MGLLNLSREIRNHGRLVMLRSPMRAYPLRLPRYFPVNCTPYAYFEIPIAPGMRSSCGTPIKLSTNNSQAKVQHKRIEVPVVVQQLKSTCETPRCNHRVNRLANRHAKPAQRTKILRRLDCDLGAA